MGSELEQFWVMDLQGRTLFSVDASALPDPEWWSAVSRRLSTHASCRVTLDDEGLELMAWRMTSVSLVPDGTQTVALRVRSSRDTEAAYLTDDVSTGAHLTPRQMEVSEYAASGATVHEIATHLGISAETVRSHLKTVYRNLGIANRVELARAMTHRHPTPRAFNAFMY